ncbi:hypothetical protein B0H13DRAFT_1867866 [Mycena leptocephala]|nr:hypothetical protein B0H13DRAFT_1867866 [Mycena leptocephala]
MPVSNIETLNGLTVAAPEHGSLMNGPKNCAFTAHNIPGPEQDIKTHALVPRNHVGLRGWAYVASNSVQHDSTRAVILFYKHLHVNPDAPANTVYPVGIRVQGFIECGLQAVEISTRT